MDAHTDLTNDECECNAQPSVQFLLATLLLTSCSTAMLCAAIMTDHWEHVTWSRNVLDVLVNESNARLEWYLDGLVARVVEGDYDEKFRKGGTFLVPMHGGIWTLCVTLTDDEIHLLSRVGFPIAHSCVNYLAGGLEGARGEEPGSDWQHRMQNLSISCALVCLIVLGSAALVGAFGVCKHQISAILITGVMYLLAALFALFTLMIIHFKRQQSRPRSAAGADGTVDGVVGGARGFGAAQDFLGARLFRTAWSLELGWGGVLLCAVASFFWILLSKIMRVNPLSAMLV